MLVLLLAAPWLHGAAGTATSSPPKRHKKLSTGAARGKRSSVSRQVKAGPATRSQAAVVPTSRKNAARRASRSGAARKTRSKAHAPSGVHLRLAHMQMAPQRVEEIQRALIAAGDLRGAPTGEWDAETRDAMSRYQAQNGFGVTGLPDAKSLMKLGLGPHPLPESLSPSQAQAATPSTDEETRPPTGDEIPFGSASDPKPAAGPADPQ